MIELTSIQRGCVYDGQGVRATVFLRGCDLRCPWCCNPETWVSAKYIVDRTRCLHYLGLESSFCKGCYVKEGTGLCTSCNFNAIIEVAKKYTPESLFDILKLDIRQMAATYGGVTFSGGEPLLQASALVPLLSLLKNVHIDICFETSLVASLDALKCVIPYVDEFIIDVKLQPEMKLRDKKYIHDIRQRLEIIPSETRISYRIVFVNSLNDHKSEVLSNLKELGITNIEVLKVHNMATTKYINLGLDYAEFTVDEDEFYDFCNYLSDNDIIVDPLSV